MSSDSNSEESHGKVKISDLKKLAKSGDESASERLKEKGYQYADGTWRRKDYRSVEDLAKMWERGDTRERYNAQRYFWLRGIIPMTVRGMSYYFELKPELIKDRVEISRKFKACLREQHMGTLEILKEKYLK